jgi:putative FmdB family regulatory protein
MPIHEYTCQQCGHKFEKFTLMSQTQSPNCPVCGSANVKRQISAFARSGRSTGSSSSASCAPSG